MSLRPLPPRPKSSLAASCLVAALLLASAQALGAAPVAASAASGSALELGPGDLRIEQLSDGGYHLYVRAKSGLGSVLLTESTADPSEKADSFAYRALAKNEVNGGERRILDGKVLASRTPLYFLVDSSPEPDAAFGSAFHIFIPWVVAWGYPWSRSGEAFVHDGSFVNIRAFAKSCADYSGPFRDNPYLIRVSQAKSGPAAASAKSAASPAPDAADNAAIAPRSAAAPKATNASAKAATGPVDARLYIPETLAAFKAIARANRGELAYASSDADITGRIDGLLARQAGKSLDLVLCVDATDTMIGALGELRSRLPAALGKRLSDFPSYRLGIVSYKDYFEEYLYKRFDFTRDLSTFASELGELHGGGGRDIPEAVYEALDAAASEFPWEAQVRLVVLVGDAPPHPLPRGSISSAELELDAKAQGIEIDAVAVPK